MTCCWTDGCWCGTPVKPSALIPGLPNPNGPYGQDAKVLTPPPETGATGATVVSGVTGDQSLGVSAAPEDESGLTKAPGVEKTDEGEGCEVGIDMTGVYDPAVAAANLGGSCLDDAIAGEYVPT